MPFIVESAWVVLAVVVVLRVRAQHRAQKAQLRADAAAAVYFAPAEVLLQAGQLRPALHEATRLLHTAPPEWQAHGYGLRAAAWLAAGSPQASLRDCNEVLSRRPFAASAYRQRTEAHLAMHDYEAARDAVAYARRLDPHDHGIRALDSAIAEYFRQPVAAAAAVPDYPA